MDVALKVSSAAVVSLSVAASACAVGCYLRIPPFHGWMAGHHCPLAMSGMSRVPSMKMSDQAEAISRPLHVPAAVPN